MTPGKVLMIPPPKKIKSESYLCIISLLSHLSQSISSRHLHRALDYAATVLWIFLGSRRNLTSSTGRLRLRQANTSSMLLSKMAALGSLDKRMEPTAKSSKILMTESSVLQYVLRRRAQQHQSCKPSSALESADPYIMQPFRSKERTCLRTISWTQRA